MNKRTGNAKPFAFQITKRVAEATTPREAEYTCLAALASYTAPQIPSSR